MSLFYADRIVRGIKKASKCAPTASRRNKGTSHDGIRGVDLGSSRRNAPAAASAAAKGVVVRDLIYVVITFAFFASCVGLVRGCDALIGDDRDELGEGDTSTASVVESVGSDR